MQSTGQVPSQAPQLMQSVLMVYAMFSSIIEKWYPHCTTFKRKINVLEKNFLKFLMANDNIFICPTLLS